MNATFANMCMFASVTVAMMAGFDRLLVRFVGPTVATVGLSMQVPFAVVLDAIFKQPAWLSSASSAALTFVGAALVLTGFFGINVASAKADEHAPA